MKVLKITLCFCLLSMNLYAQERGGLRGFVYNIKNREAVILATVTINGTKLGANTDVNGFFNISNVEAGKYTVMIRSVGFDTLYKEVQVEKGKINTISIGMTEKSRLMKSIDITAKKQLGKTKVSVSTVNISPKEIAKLPSIGGESDIAQYIQVVPGVVSSGDQGGQVYIRGGTPVMTKFLLDGMTVYNPFHSIGFFSTYETEIIKNVDIYTGGFNAKFGNRVSAVVDVTTRDGNKNNFSGKISMSPWATKTILEGPILKPKEEGSGLGISYILSGKYSYLDKSSEVFYPHIKDQLPYSFMDFYGKMNISTKTGLKLNLFGFNFKDDARFFDVANFTWRNSGGGFNATVVPDKSNIVINMKGNYTSYNIDLIESSSFKRNSNVDGFEFGIDMASFMKNGEFKYGFDFTGLSTSFQFTNRFGQTFPAQNQNTTEFSAYTILNYVLGKFVMEPSVRLQYYGSISTFSLEPRLGVKYNATEFLRFKIATGLYTQNLISSKSDRDIVNLFNGFIAGTDESLRQIDGSPANSNVQSSIHSILGIEIYPAKNWTINVEPYYMYYPQIININRKKQFNSDPNFMIETGESKGVDLSVKYDAKRINIWANYSLSSTTRNDGTMVYPTFYDRRHNANILASVTLGKNYDWEFSARWNFGSGFPFTKTQAFFEEQYNPADINNPYTVSNGNIGVIYDSVINGGRLPYFHRLDFSGKKTFKLGEKAKLEINISIINMYDRNNIFYFDRIKYKRVDQLPFIPSIGISAIF